LQVAQNESRTKQTGSKTLLTFQCEEEQDMLAAEKSDGDELEESIAELDLPDQADTCTKINRRPFKSNELEVSQELSDLINKYLPAPREDRTISQEKQHEHEETQEGEDEAVELDLAGYLKSIDKNREQLLSGKDSSQRLSAQQDMQSFLTALTKEGSVVTLPDNFNEVVGLMGRKDLGNNEQNRPWSKYLIQDGLDKKAEYNGFKAVFADEESEIEKLEHELARIRQLDVKLRETSRKAKEISLNRKRLWDEFEREELRKKGIVPDDPPESGRQTPSSVADSDLYTDLSSRRSDRPGTGLSQNSEGGDSYAAFVTQKKHRRPNIPSTQNTSRSTRRASINEKEEEKDFSDGKLGPGKIRRRKREEKKKDFVADNRRDVGQRLTQEQEELVARLLEDWEGNTVQDGNTPGPQGIWEEISRYGVSEDEELRLAYIDKQLREMGTLKIIEERILADLTETSHSQQQSIKEKEDQTIEKQEARNPKSKKEQLPGDAVLREELKQRKERQRLSELDAALEALMQAESILVLETSDKPSESTQPQKRLTSGKFIEKNLEYLTRPITSNDIDELVVKLKEEKAAETLAPQYQIKELLGKFQHDIEKLQLQRHDGNDLWEQIETLKRQDIDVAFSEQIVNEEQQVYSPGTAEFSGNFAASDLGGTNNTRQKKSLGAKKHVETKRKKGLDKASPLGGYTSLYRAPLEVFLEKEMLTNGGGITSFSEGKEAEFESRVSGSSNSAAPAVQTKVF